MLLAMLLAICWQAFVTQTHLHLDHNIGSGAIAGGTHAPAPSISEHLSPDLQADCPFCEEVAHAGHYLLPALAAIHLPERAIAWRVDGPPDRSSLRQRSHAWRSRAPPSPFQA